MTKSAGATEYSSASHWTLGTPGCEASTKAAHHKRADRIRHLVTGQGKGNALPLGAASVAAASWSDEFHTAISAIVRGNKDALAELYDSTVAKVHGLIKAIDP